MTRGTPTIRRVNARNYIKEEANKRLKEVIVPYQKQGLNALGVDSYEVLLFLRTPSTQACTCRETQMSLHTETDVTNAPDLPKKSGISESHEINIEWKRPLFGEPHEARIEEEDGTELGDYDFDDSPSPHANQVFESSPDCGICYRTGYVPGFSLYGKQRFVFTTNDIVDTYAYTINRSSAPHIFESLSQSGWVEFELVVPKYFKSVRYSIRNNLLVLPDALSTMSGDVTLAYFKQMAGSKVRLRVSSEAFTHLVITFDVGADPILANIAQMSRQTDWTTFTAIGNLSVILPMTIPELTLGSVIFVPKTSMALIVTDQTYLRPAEGSNLDWQVTARVCQPQEAFLRIHKDLPIL